MSNVSPPDPPADLRLTLLGAEGVRLRWTGVFGRGYRIERTLDPSTETWEAVGAVGGNEAGPTEFIDPEAATREQGFYRLLPS